jgi:hypothetical protein
MASFIQIDSADRRSFPRNDTLISLDSLPIRESCRQCIDAAFGKEKNTTVRR